MADTFESFNRKVSAFQRELTADTTSHKVGKMAKDQATKAASADLGGDPKFSGWAPKLTTRYDIVGPGRVSFYPNRRAAGPWTVAESGRNQSGMHGPNIRSSSLTKTGRKRKARSKWNGRTQGKGTATTALAHIEDEVPKIVQSAVGRAIAKTF